MTFALPSSPALFTLLAGVIFFVLLYAAVKMCRISGRLGDADKEAEGVGSGIAAAMLFIGAIIMGIVALHTSCDAYEYSTGQWIKSPAAVTECKGKTTTTTTTVHCAGCDGKQPEQEEEENDDAG